MFSEKPNFKAKPLETAIIEATSLQEIKPINEKFYRFSNHHPILHIRYQSAVDMERAAVNYFIELRKSTIEMYARFGGKIDCKPVMDIYTVTDERGKPATRKVVDWKDLGDGQEEMIDYLTELTEIKQMISYRYNKRCIIEVAVRKLLSEQLKKLRTETSSIESALR
jgi:hypothetical protein